MLLYTKKLVLLYSSVDVTNGALIFESILNKKYVLEKVLKMDAVVSVKIKSLPKLVFGHLST